jgi:large subunit ribosomal protein L17
MRHKKAGRKFGRNTSHRRAMLRALTANLVAHERIETTDAKAKELRRVAERLITRAVRLGPIAYTPHDQLSVADRLRRQSAQRQVAEFLRRFAVVQKDGQEQKIDLLEKVFVDLTVRFHNRPGGYTRIIKLGRRRGDNAPMSLVEFVEGFTAPPRRPTQKKRGPKEAPETTEAAAAPVAEAAAAEKPKRAKKAKAEKSAE